MAMKNPAASCEECTRYPNQNGTLANLYWAKRR